MNILKMISDMRNDINKAQKTLEERTVNRHENNASNINSVNEKVDIDEEGLCEVAEITSDETDANIELAGIVSDLMDAVAELGEIVASKEV